MEQPDVRNTNSGKVTNLTQIGTVHGDLTIFTGDRPVPTATAARPYLLLETGEVVGRTALRNGIEEFLAGAAASVLVLIGVPGIGKSALAWDAWKRLRETGRRQFWYSFYDGRGVGSFAGMLPELNRFLGLPSEASVGEVLDAVAEQEIVLFLDGIERCLRCYQRPLAAGDLDALRIRESDLWHDTELGFASADALRFFLQLTELPAGRVVATSRVVPADYFASGGGLRAGVTSHVVGPLSPGESSALLDAVGSPITPADAAMVASALGGHPLALQLLVRQVRRSRQPRQSLPAWLAAQGYLAAEGAGPQQIRDRLFVRAATALTTPACLLLAATGVLGGAVDLPSLRAVDPSALTDDQFHQAVEEIVASGLGTTTSDDEFACHPLTASAAMSRLEPGQTTELVRALSTALRGRFAEITRWRDGYVGWFMAGVVSDRAEAMALCRALVRLEEWQEAARLYLWQLDVPVRYVLGANFEAVEVLRALVDGLASEPGDFTPDDLRPSLAHHLLMIGRIDQAAAVLGAMTDGLDEHETLMVRSSVALHRGHFGEALEHALTAVHGARRKVAVASIEDEVGDLPMYTGPNLDRLARPAGDQIEAMSRCAQVLMLAGRRAEAAALLVRGLALWRWGHYECEGCHGLLIRTAATLFSGDTALALSSNGKELQAAQGKALQGLLCDVIVTARSAEAGPELAAALGDAGFVLYQLVVQAARSAQAADALQDAGCRSLPALLGRESAPLPARLVNAVVGWLDGAPTDDELPELTALASEMTPAETCAAWLTTAEECSRSGDLVGHQRALARAHEIDPHDSGVLGALAASAVRTGDVDTALRHLECMFDVDPENSYSAAVDLVSEPGPFADRLRDLIVKGRPLFAAVDALIAMAHKLDDEAQVLKWRQARGRMVRAALGPDFL